MNSKLHEMSDYEIILMLYNAERDQKDKVDTLDVLEKRLGRSDELHRYYAMARAVRHALPPSRQEIGGCVHSRIERLVQVLPLLEKTGEHDGRAKEYAKQAAEELGKRIEEERVLLGIDAPPETEK